MNHDSSVLFQSAQGCHSNHTELSLYLAPSTDLPAVLGAEGILHRIAAVLIHIILFLYTLILNHFFSWAIIKETKSCKIKIYLCFDQFPPDQMQQDRSSFALLKASYFHFPDLPFPQHTDTHIHTYTIWMSVDIFEEIFWREILNL